MAPAFRTDHTKRAGLDAVALADGDEHVVTSALIAPSRRAPSQARRFVEQSLCPTHARDAENALLLAASEMATQTVGRDPSITHLHAPPMMVCDVEPGEFDVGVP